MRIRRRQGGTRDWMPITPSNMHATAMLAEPKRLA